MRVLFLLPTIAVGVDEAGYFFAEAGWLQFAIGLGNTSEGDE